MAAEFLAGSQKFRLRKEPLHRGVFELHPHAHKFANARKDNRRTEAERVLGEHKWREIAERSRWEERDKTDRTKTGKTHVEWTH